MDAPHVDIPYVRVFPYPVDVAYAWLTDYDDQDAQRAGAIIAQREVVKRDGDTVVLDAELVTLGRRSKGRAEVTLFPKEHRWVATLHGGRAVYTYQLTPVPQGARLEVHYRIAARRWTRRAVLTLAKPRIRREIDAMWAGFARAMERELAQPAPTV